jgi:putative Holliday junction resolvase
MPVGGGRVLALDVGDRRIGVAVSDESGTIASPLATVARGREDLAAIGRLVTERQISRLVVGLPTGLSGREGPQATKVRAFAAELAAVLGPDLPIEFWDERLTTTIAERSLIEAGTSRARRRERIDAVAAAVILQGYLEATRRRERRDRRQPA